MFQGVPGYFKGVLKCVLGGFNGCQGDLRRPQGASGGFKWRSRRSQGQFCAFKGIPKFSSEFPGDFGGVLVGLSWRKGRFKEFQGLYRVFLTEYQWVTGG